MRHIYVIIALLIPPGFVPAQQIATLAQSGAGQAHLVTVDLRDVTLSSAIEATASQAGLKAVYADNKIPKRFVTLKVQNVSVTDAMERLLRGTGLTAKVDPAGLLKIVDASVKTSNQDQGSITGRITESKGGKGISGANVSVDNDSRVLSGEDGFYRLAGIASGTHIITVRLVGYTKQTRQVIIGEGVSAVVDFKLESSANVLDQVVVTGTVVSTELKAVPNAITVITAKQIEERGITRIDQLFRGEIPGLFSLNFGAVSPSGIGPSLDEVVMYSRGATKMSIVNTDASTITNPIKTYVDGIEMADSKYLSQIDPKSIERIEILTGPQASTIYGAGATNGVMQIFTKRGSGIRPQVTFAFSEGFIQNNFSTALASSHQYNGSISGTEGRLSYNVGTGWDYTGAWSPGKQLQRTSVYGGGRYQSRVFSVDLSSRQGWTTNKAEGDVSQVLTDMAENGQFIRSTISGLSIPTKSSLSGRTYGLIFSFNPFVWWSHQINLGRDASNSETINLSPGFRSSDDTSFTNIQSFNTRISESYSSTVNLSIGSIVRTTLTFGGDHWRTRSSNLSWTAQPLSGGTITNSTVTSSRPGKNIGAYVQGQFSFLEQLFLTYGIRTDWNPNYGENAKVRPGRYGVSYSREFGSISAKLRGSYGRSIVPPSDGQIQGVSILPSNTSTLAIYAVPGSVLYSTLPSPDLGPEFQQGGEGGLELYLGNRGSLIITRYNQTVDGLINNIQAVDSARALQPGFGAVSATGCNSSSPLATNQLRSDGYCYLRQRQNLNAGSIRNQGWELHSNVNLGPFTTRATYSFTKSRVIGITPRYRSLLTDQAFAPGQTFNFVPEHTWAIGASYVLRRTSASIDINGLGASLRRADFSDLGRVTSSNLRLRTEEAYNFSNAGTFSLIRVPVSGYATAHMNISHQFSEKIEGSLQVNNLTNHYQNDFYYAYPTLGRETRLGARFHF